MIAATRPLDELVKPEMKEKWMNGPYQEMMVVNENDPVERREPGKLKPEQRMTNGSFVALSPKVIFCCKKNRIQKQSLVLFIF